jgi:PAS domain S-box-containing protein
MDNSKPISLLVVEDNEHDFRLLENYLKTSFCTNEIVWANNFEKAKEFLKKKTFDVALIDYTLDKVTGIDVIDYINSNFTFVPSILLTNLKEEATDKKALLSGAFDCLVKDQYTADSVNRSIRYTIEKAKVLKSLKESENKFRALFENAMEYLLIIDSDYKILDANKAASKIFGFHEKEDLINLPITDFLPLEIFEQPFTTLLKSNKFDLHISTEIEFTIHKSNKKHYCFLNLSLVDPEKSIIQLVLHDVTEKKAIEHNEKILEKQALTGKVARIIAHEIKNPLTNIQLSLTELKAIHQMITVKNTEDSPLEFLDIIDRNSMRINKLIEDLLNATRFDTLEFNDISMEDLIDAAIALVDDRINLKEIVLQKNVKSGIYVNGDKEKLTIALVNIFINAIEAIETKGILSIDTNANEKDMTITITDNGIGISSEHIIKLFEPFFTSKKGGTGLGLSATYSIITKHDGTIKVESKVGAGTTFTINLPTVALKSDKKVLTY